MQAFPRCAALLCPLLLVGTATAESAGPVAGQPTYPFTIRLRLSPQTIASHFVHQGPNGTLAPSNPGCSVAVGEQARDAYVAIARQMFRPALAEGPADLELEIAIVKTDFERDASSWRAVAEHLLVLRVSSGDELGRWSLRGDSPILSMEDERAIPAAFARAASDSAHQFELVAAHPPKVEAWLQEHGAVAVLLRPRPQDRGAYVAYFDVGGGLVSGGDGNTSGLLARAGLASTRFVGQIVTGRWTTSFSANPVFYTYPNYPDAELATNAVGLEGGLVHRFSTDVEIRGGAGAHLLWGRANMPYRTSSGGRQEIAFAFSCVAPAVFGVVQYAKMTGSGVAVRGGFEARHYFGAIANFAELQRSPTIAENYFGFFLGLELPEMFSRSRKDGK